MYTGIDDEFSLNCFQYCLDNHISFFAEEVGSFINSTTNTYDVVIYDLDKNVMAKGENHVDERSDILLPIISNMLKTPSTCNSLIILLTSINYVYTKVSMNIHTMFRDMNSVMKECEWMFHEFFHIPEPRHFVNNKKSQSIPWVRAIVLAKNLTWNENDEIQQICEYYFKDKYTTRSPIISNFEMVPPLMRMADKARHSPHVFVKPSLTVNNILCKFYPHISSLIKPVGRTPKVLCIDSGIFIIPMDLLLTFGVDVDILEKTSDTWDSWCLRENAKYMTKDNNIKKYSTQFHLLFREIVNEGQYKKILLNGQFISNVKIFFNNLINDSSVSNSNHVKPFINVNDEEPSSYCYVCGSTDNTNLKNPKQLRFLCNLCSLIDSSHFANPKPESTHIYSSDLYYKYFSSSSAPLPRNDPWWLTMATPLTFKNQFSRFYFNVEYHKGFNSISSNVSLLSVTEGNCIKEGDVIGSLWGTIGTVDIIKHKIENTKYLLFPIIRLLADWNPLGQSPGMNTPFLLCSPYCFLSWIPTCKSKRQCKPNVCFRVNKKLVEHAISNCALATRMVPAGVVEVVAVSCDLIVYVTIVTFAVCSN